MDNAVFPHPPLTQNERMENGKLFLQEGGDHAREKDREADGRRGKKRPTKVAA